MTLARPSSLQSSSPPASSLRAPTRWITMDSPAPLVRWARARVAVSGAESREERARPREGVERKVREERRWAMVGVEGRV